ncbi:MAG: aldolase/citrate lyase family protein [Candidatus Margulisiibacteriota bacterium]
MEKVNKHRADLKNKLRRRQKILGGWTSLAHPSIVEIFARSGIDFVGIDVEHSTISLEQCQNIIAACQANGKMCLPRVASHNQEAIKRLLDSGADGIILPMVSTTKEAQDLISWAKYPPQGKRSFGIARAQGYGFDFSEYVKDANDSLSLIVQIESIQGVENIDGILALEGIDGVMVGPYDLSGSLGLPGKLGHPKVAAACSRVIEACAKHNKACGTQDIDPDLNSVKTALAKGYTFVVLASDVFLLWKWSEKMNDIIEMIR